MQNIQRVHEAIRALGFVSKDVGTSILIDTSVGSITIESNGDITYDRGLESQVLKIKDKYADLTLKSFAKKYGYPMSRQAHPETGEEMLVIDTGL